MIDMSGAIYCEQQNMATKIVSLEAPSNEFMPISRLLTLLAITLLGGCASTSGYHNPKDPFEPLNRSVYKFNDSLDKAIVKPVAKGYNTVVPVTGRTMVSNFFSNLDDVLVTLNDVLQLKLVQAISDGGRVLINTTIGAFGLVDAAAASGFQKHHADFGQTLGYWGIGSGPYLVLPLLGPSSVRDSVGLYTDTITAPTAHLRPILRNQLFIADNVRQRSKLLENENILDTAEIDRYSFIRDAYLARRQNLVYDGNPPREKYEDEEEGDSAPLKAPGTKTQPDKTPGSGSAASSVPATVVTPGGQ